MSRLIPMVALLACFLGGGCTVSQGTLSQQGYYYEELRYWVRFHVPATMTFVNDEWQVDNWIRVPYTRTDWQRKSGSAYLGYRMVESPEGEEPTEERVFLYDLKLTHKLTNGVIWSQSFALSQSQRHKQLDVLLNNYADSLSGTGLYGQGDIYSIKRAKLRKFAARLAWKRSLQRGPYLVLYGLIEVIDLERQRVDKAYEPERVLLAITRIALLGGKSALVLFGYHNTADHFEKYVGAFRAFLQNTFLFPLRSRRVPVVDAKTPSSFPQAPVPRLESQPDPTAPVPLRRDPPEQPPP